MSNLIQLMEQMTDEYFDLTEAIAELEHNPLVSNKNEAINKCKQFNKTKNKVMCIVRDKWCKYEYDRSRR